MRLSLSNLRTSPHLRAGLIAFHLAAITAGSLPVLVDERGLKEEVFQDPLVQAEFEQWADQLTSLGMEVTPKQFGDFTWNIAEGMLKTQRSLQAPFEFYYEEAGTRQRWRMFPGAVENPTRLRIDIQEGGEWRTVYRMGSTEPNEGWLGKWLDRDRFRAALNLYAWDVYPEAYEEFADWLAGKAAASYPDAERMRVGFEVVPAPTPEESREAKERMALPWEKAKQKRELELAEYRSGL